MLGSVFLVVRSFSGVLQTDGDGMAAGSQDRGRPAAAASLTFCPDTHHNTVCTGDQKQSKPHMETLPRLAARSLWRRRGKDGQGFYLFPSL